MRSIAGSGRATGRTIRCRTTRSRRSIAIDFCRSRRLDKGEIYPQITQITEKYLCNLWLALGDDHRAGALVGEDFGEERVAFRPADDVCAVNAAFQQDDDALELGNHAAGRC